MGVNDNKEIIKKQIIRHFQNLWLDKDIFKGRLALYPNKIKLFVICTMSFMINFKNV